MGSISYGTDGTLVRAKSSGGRNPRQISLLRGNDGRRFFITSPGETLRHSSFDFESKPVLIIKGAKKSEFTYRTKGDTGIAILRGVGKRIRVIVLQVKGTHVDIVLEYGGVRWASNMAAS